MSTNPAALERLWKQERTFRHWARMCRRLRLQADETALDRRELNDTLGLVAGDYRHLAADAELPPWLTAELWRYVGGLEKRGAGPDLIAPPTTTVWHCKQAIYMDAAHYLCGLIKRFQQELKHGMA